MCCIIPTDTGTFCELQVYNKIISFAIKVRVMKKIFIYY